jgi:hypothetical protein
VTQLLNLQPAAAATLQKWHEMMAKLDLSDLPLIVHPEVTFRSPLAFNPYASVEAMVMALQTVVTVFSDFSYHREAATDDGLSVVLEFSAKIAGKGVKGADLIRFDTEGRIVDFEVMVRPLNGLIALSEEMGKRMGDRMPSYKAKA